MNYSINDDEFAELVEVNKTRVKNQILEAYVSLRKERGYTQQQIADMTGMKRSNIVRIESGKYVPTIEVLTKLAVALNMKLEISLKEDTHNISV